MADGTPPTPADAVPAPFDPPPPLQAWREEGHGRRVAPDAVWAEARDDYLAGLSAPEVCARHGLRLSTLRGRAAGEGWRRADQPWSPPNRLDIDDEGVELEARVGGDLNKIELRELSYIALRRSMRAVLRGDATAALRWIKVREAMDAESAELARQAAQDEAIWQARFGWREADEADAVDAVDAVDADFAASDADGVDGVDAVDAVDGVSPPLRPSPPAGDGGSRSETDEGSRDQDRPDPSSGPSGHLLPQGEKGIWDP